MIFGFFISHRIRHPSKVEIDGFKNYDKDNISVNSISGYYNFEQKYMYILFTMSYAIFFDSKLFDK